MDNEQHHQELVKCVVVGDTAVGKTRLICARACNKQLSLSQLLTTHVPTVWAIDQYRIYKDVLERSWEMVDGVNVSLRLWDTFGDHEKDRRFAYGRSDVVLLCFSLGSHNSLRNCKAMWYPEIRKFCPQTPVILVGCKNDLRFMYRDEAYLEFFRERSPFLRAIRKSDLVMPDEARGVARELGVSYYETSVLTYYGVNEVFENAIRAALIARRQQRFWMTNLKKVQRPLLQSPYCPPKPVSRPAQVMASTFDDALRWLFTAQPHTDVIFLAGPVALTAHRFMLAAASPSLQRLLCTDLTGELSTRSASESSMVSSFGEATSGDFNEDTEFLIRVEKPPRGGGVWEQLKRRSSCQVLTVSSSGMAATSHTGGGVTGATLGPCCVTSRELNHPAFSSISVQQYEELDGQGKKNVGVQTVITLTKLVSAQAMHQCLQFLYTGTIDTKFTQLQEVRQAAEFMELPELLVFVSNIQAHESFLNPELKQRYKQAVRLRLRELCVAQSLFADVLFQLDDGCLPAHRPLLQARCDMMRAMFSGDFREGSAKVIVFPGVKCDSFRVLLCYLYCDDVGAVSPGRCVDLLELANRLCLPRLIHLIEKRVIEDLARLASLGSSGNGGVGAGGNNSGGSGGNVQTNSIGVVGAPTGDQGVHTAPPDPSASSDAVVEHCLKLLEPCKLHNADQLADWCMNHLCTNYNRLCKMSPKLLRSLHPDNQDYLTENRWPPVWYLKDYDYYDKCISEREKEDRMVFKRASTGTGCLCFSGGGGGSDGGTGSGGMSGGTGGRASTAHHPEHHQPLVA